MSLTRRHLRLIAASALLLSLACAPSALAGTTSTLANFLNPINVVIGWMTGQMGRSISVLVLAGVAFNTWKSRNEGKGERALMFLVGTALLLGAPQVVEALGFIGATY